jgi:hypothetical protein
MAWQSIIISNPEDVVVYRFNELAKLAADAKKYGITTFEILGWDVGGIDRGYPQYQPNPRLGTVEEFRKALADIRAMGVHPLLFSNVQVADTATPLFRSELSRYAVDGRWAPRHYNDSVDEPLTRPLARYVAELIRIRKEYEDLLFRGRFNDTLGATVTGGADIRYSVFEPLNSAGATDDSATPVHGCGVPVTLLRIFDLNRNTASLPSPLPLRS